MAFAAVGSSFASLKKRDTRKINYSPETHDAATKSATPFRGCRLEQPPHEAPTSQTLDDAGSSFASPKKRDKRQRNYSPETHDAATKTPTTSSLGCRLEQPPHEAPVSQTLADAGSSFASLKKREKRQRNYSPETHDAATKTATSSLGCRLEQPPHEAPVSQTLVDASSSFASLERREKRKRSFTQETHDAATTTPTSSLGCRFKQPPVSQTLADAFSSFASLEKREKRKRRCTYETHDAATKTPTSSLGCGFKRPPCDASSSFASLERREKRKRSCTYETHDVATKTPKSSLGCSFKQAPHEPPVTQSCTLCQTQDHPACFKCFVASGNLFAGLRQKHESSTNKSSGHKYDFVNKTLRKNARRAASASSFASLSKRTRRTRKHRHQELCDVVATTKTQTSPGSGVKLHEVCDAATMKTQTSPEQGFKLREIDDAATTKTQTSPESGVKLHEISDAETTKTQTSPGSGFKLEVQHESPPPPSRSCTLCQTQHDPTCFKCFVASGNLFAGLQQYSNKFILSSCKSDYNKTLFGKEAYASFY